MELLNRTDEELMLLYQNGSEASFQILYDRHSSKIFGFILKRIQNKETANEVFQDVFIKIHKSKHLYNKSLPLLPWIFTITRNAVFDYAKRGNKVEIATPVEKMDERAAMEDQQELGLDFQPSLLKLPLQQKLAVEMRYYDEKTFEEIAETLNTSPMNIRKLVSRGVKRLKEIIKEGGKS